MVLIAAASCIMVCVYLPNFPSGQAKRKKIEENRSFNTAGLICFHRVFFLCIKFHQIYTRFWFIPRARCGRDARNALAWRTFKTVTAYYAYRTTYYTHPFIIHNIYLTLTYMAFNHNFVYRHLHVFITIYLYVLAVSHLR